METMMPKALTIGLFHDGISIPPKEGISVHVYELARALSHAPGIRVVLINADRGRATTKQFAHESFDTLLLPPNDYYDQDKITSIITDYHLDIVQNYNTYYIASILGPAAKKCRVPLVAEHHDLESELTFLRTSTEDDQFHQNIQRSAIQHSAASRFMSSHDFDALSKTLPGELAAKTFLMPVAFTPSQTVPSSSLHSDATAIFVGNMSYQPNHEAACDIIAHIAPIIPEVTFVIVGRGSKDLPIPDNIRNIRLLGEVDDLQAVLSKATIGLAPLSIGSGLKIKLITYLEAKLPVVCSSIAVHGFPASPALIVANSWEEYAMNIRELMSSQQHRRAASDAANRLFSDYFDITQTLPKLIEIYRTSVERYELPQVDTAIAEPDMSRFPWHNELNDDSYTPVVLPRLITGATS